MALHFSHNADDAKDIYQEIFMRVFRALPKFEFKSEFSTWLYRIATNVCLSHSTTASKSPELFDETVIEPRTPSPELGLYVQDALAALSPNQKMAFVLKHHEGYEIKEIAVIMECAEGTVKRHLFNAAERLRRVLKDALT